MQCFIENKQRLSINAQVDNLLRMVNNFGFTKFRVFVFLIERQNEKFRDTKIPKNNKVRMKLHRVFHFLGIWKWFFLLLNFLNSPKIICNSFVQRIWTVFWKRRVFTILIHIFFKGIFQVQQKVGNQKIVLENFGVLRESARSICSNWMNANHWFFPHFHKNDNETISVFTSVFNDVDFVVSKAERMFRVQNDWVIRLNTWIVAHLNFIEIYHNFLCFCSQHINEIGMILGKERSHSVWFSRILGIEFWQSQTIRTDFLI